jgi:2-dehydro-3-deoxygluconokinase
VTGEARHLGCASPAGRQREFGLTDIVCYGEPLIELNQNAADGSYRPGFGGDTSNCAVAAARQGASVAYVSAVGSDAFGDRFFALWQREGVDAGHVHRDSGAPTGVYFVNHGPEGHSFSYMRAGSAASRYRPDMLPLDLIAGARMLHLSAISQAISASACDAGFAAMEAARAAGVPVAYDTNLRLRLWDLPRARAIICGALRIADIARPSVDDAQHLFGTSEPNEIIEAVRALGPRIVVLTLGRDGALVDADGRREHVPGHRVEAVDATGAGDTFDGSFLAEFLRTGDAFAAARYANVAAALQTRGYGAVGPMPYRADVEAELAAGSARPA